MPMTERLADLSPLSLSEIAALVEGQSAPPVDQWHPARMGEIDIRIARDGRWFHEGSLIARDNLVRLFSSILRREADGRHILVTPGEALTITVEDAAFLAVELKTDRAGKERSIAFRLNTGGLIIANAEHRLIARGDEDNPAHYLEVRHGLEARISRAVYYELAEIALAEGTDPLGVWSEGFFFPL